MKIIHTIAFLVGIFIGGYATYALAAPADNILEWDPTPGATTIHIERKDTVCSGSGTWNPIGTTPAVNETYTDPAVSSPYTVCYRVSASNEHGKSGYSNEAGKVPGAPTGLMVP